MARDSIFIGYRRDDTADVAGRLYDALVLRFGRNRIFKDVDNLRPGADFGAHIRDILPKCRAALILMGPGWAEARDESGRRRLEDPNDWVRIEIEIALAAPGVDVVPVLVNNAMLPRPEQLPEALRPLLGRHAATIRRDPDFHDDVARLASALRVRTESDGAIGGARTGGNWVAPALLVAAALAASFVVALWLSGAGILTKRAELAPPRAETLKQAGPPETAPAATATLAREQTAASSQPPPDRYAAARAALGRITRAQWGQGNWPAIRVQMGDALSDANLWALAREGDRRAQFLVVVCGLTTTSEDYIGFVRRSAAQDFAPAQAELGMWLVYGMQNLQRDPQEGLRLLRRATDQGDAWGQMRLGFLYERGEGGLRPNLEEAIRLYRLSAAQGNPNAREQLTRLGETW